MANITRLQGLERVLTAGQVVTNPIELMTYEGDASLDRGVPDAVVFPRDVERRWLSSYSGPASPASPSSRVVPGQDFPAAL